MKYFVLIFWFIAVSGFKIQAQTPENVAYNMHAHWHKTMTEKLDLVNLSASKDDFIFRFWHKGQIVDITRNGDSIQGILTNYFFRILRKRNVYLERDTFFIKTILDNDKVKTAYEYILSSGILSIPSDSLSGEWITRHQSGYALIGLKSSESECVNFFSALTYQAKVKDEEIEEDSEQQELFFEQIFEMTDIIDRFISRFSEILELPREYRKFEKHHMQEEGYYLKGWEFRSIYVNNFNFYLGYYGSGAMPFGFWGGLSVGTIKKFRPKTALQFQHMVDFRNQYDFQAIVSKNEIFFPATGKMPDMISYHFRQASNARDPLGIDYTTRLHQIKYGFFLSAINLNLAAGTSYLAGDTRDFGPLFSFYMRPFEAKLAFHSDQLDYRFSYSPIFILDSYYPIRYLMPGVHYERFREQKGFQFWLGLVF